MLYNINLTFDEYFNLALLGFTLFAIVVKFKSN